MNDNGIFELQSKTVLSEEIYLTLRNAILEGKLEPGMRLVETTIANQMGVSRAPLREAIRQLQKDGLVESKVHRETRVVSFSLRDIQELHMLRTVLETLAFQYASNSISQKELAYIELLVEHIEIAANESNSNELAKLDYEFHEQLCRASGWPRLYRIWQDQHILLRMWFNVVAQSDKDQMQVIAEDHRRMLNAIKTKDHKAIATEVFNHIYYSGPAYVEERRKWASEAEAQFQLLFVG